MPDPIIPRAVADTHTHDIEALQLRIEKLKLYSAALTLLVMEKLGVTQDEVENTVALIGGDDGTMKKSVLKCPKCQKAVNRKAMKCMYCGNSEFPMSFLERL